MSALSLELLEPGALERWSERAKERTESRSGGVQLGGGSPGTKPTTCGGRGAAAAGRLVPLVRAPRQPHRLAASSPAASWAAQGRGREETERQAAHDRTLAQGAGARVHILNKNQQRTSHS